MYKTQQVRHYASHLGRWGFNGLSGHENNAPKISAKRRFDVAYHREAIGSTPSILIIVKRETRRGAVRSTSFDIARNPAEPTLRKVTKCIRSSASCFFVSFHGCARMYEYIVETR